MKNIPTLQFLEQESQRFAGKRKIKLIKEDRPSKKAQTVRNAAYIEQQHLVDEESSNASDLASEEDEANTDFDLQNDDLDLEDLDSEQESDLSDEDTAQRAESDDDDMDGLKLTDSEDEEEIDESDMEEMDFDVCIGLNDTLLLIWHVGGC